jgi:hypothetical protein
MDGKMILARLRTRTFKKKNYCYLFEEVGTSMDSLLLHCSYPVLEPGSLLHYDPTIKHPYYMYTLHDRSWY